MKMCVFCKGDSLTDSVTTYVATLKDCIIIVKNVPCEEYVQCGEKYYSDEVMEKIEDIISHAKQIASEVVVTDYNKKVA